MKEGYLMIWKKLDHPIIENCYLISSDGDILVEGLDESKSYKATYHSSNGYDYSLFNIRNEFCKNDTNFRLFPMNAIMALVYIPVPFNLNGKRIKVHHINGDTRDISLDNLEWIEDVEEWRTCTYPGVKPDTYEISSWGNIRNKNNEYIVRYLNYGYECCYVRNTNDEKKLFLIHRLVWFQFIKSDGDPIKSFVNHINLIRNNNNVMNLETSTPKLNVLHALDNSKSRSGLTADIIRRICECIIKYSGDTDLISRDLSTDGFDISNRMINSIKEKYVWKHISDEYFDNEYCRRNMTKQTVEEICKLLIEYNGKVTDVHEQLLLKNIDINIHTINSIRSKRNWKHISDKYFDDEYFTIKRIDGPRVTLSIDDVRLVCKMIIEYNGNTSKIKKYFDSINKPYISYATIKNIKNKECWRHISDEYFDDNEYSRMLSVESVKLICETIAKYKNIRNCRKIVFNELKSSIPNLTISDINHIYYKNSWKSISDRFF